MNVKKFRLNLISGCFAFLLSITAFAQTGISVEQLDAPIAEAGSIKGFLNNKNLRDRYYELLRAYYGFDDSVFPRSSYDTFLQQLSGLITAIPEMDQVFYQKNTPESFEIKAVAGSDDIRLDKNLWKKSYTEWLSHLETAAGNQGSDADLAHAREVLDREQINYDQNIAAAKTNPNKGAVGQFINSLKQNQQLQSAVATAVLGVVKKNADLFANPPNASTLLYNLTAFRADGVLSGYPQILEKFSSNYTLDAKKLFGAKVLQTSGANQIRVRTITGTLLSRQFHSIWNGVCVNSCMGGKLKTMDKLTPIAWANGSIEGAKSFHLTSGTDFLGWLDLIPVRNKTTKEKFTTLMPGASILGQPFLRIKNGLAYEQAPLLQMMIDDPKIPWLTDNKKIILSESNAYNNAGVLPLIRATNAYRMGIIIGPSADFETLNPNRDGKIQHFSTANYTNAEYAAAYGFKLVSDISWIDAGNIVQLKPLADNVLVDSYQARTSLDQGPKNPRLLANLIQSAKAESAAENVVLKHWENLDSITKAEILEKVKLDAATGTLIFSDLLFKTVAKTPADIADLFTKKIPFNPQHDKVLLANMNAFFEHGASMTQLRQLYQTFKRADGRIDLIKAGLRKTSNLQQIYELLPQNLLPADTAFNRRFIESMPIVLKRAMDLKTSPEDQQKLEAHLEGLKAQSKQYNKGLCSEIFS